MNPEKSVISGISEKSIPLDLISATFSAVKVSSLLIIKKLLFFCCNARRNYPYSFSLRENSRQDNDAVYISKTNNPFLLKGRMLPIHFLYEKRVIEHTKDFFKR